MLMTRYIAALLMGLFCCCQALADDRADSLTAAVPDSASAMGVMPGPYVNHSERLKPMVFVGVPIVVGVVSAKNLDGSMRGFRNDCLSRFSYHADDYLQYAPAAVMLGMKAFGVRGRSSWGRMLASDAVSVVLMAGVVTVLKRTTNVTRPDGSDNHSFPSGHTATAFMTATMLTKEYGYKSPWIGVGAYTAAAATGVMRIANNKHWLSDVLAGAGIGILSAELGYHLTDLMYRSRNRRRAARLSLSYVPTPVRTVSGTEWLGTLTCGIPLSH